MLGKTLTVLPPILLGALGPKMTEVAGEVADGLIVTPFNTMSFLKKSLACGHVRLRKGGRLRDDFIMQVNAIVITGETDEEYQAAEDSVKFIRFLLLTPSYKLPWILWVTVT